MTAMRPPADPPPPKLLTAHVVARDIRPFEALIDEMDLEFGSNWGILCPAEALALCDAPPASRPELFLLALAEADEAELPPLLALAGRAREAGIALLLMAERIGPMALHQLLRAGARDVLPYPPPSGALREALGRIARAKPAATSATKAKPLLLHPGMRPPPAGQEAASQPPPPPPTPRGLILAVQAMAGGAGASTLAVHLAMSLARGRHRAAAGHVALIDLDLQHGAVAGYLGLSSHMTRPELLLHADALRERRLRAAMQETGPEAGGRLCVLTAPEEMLPHEVLAPAGIARLTEILRRSFDVTVIDMPTTVTRWTESVYGRADCWLAVLTPEPRAVRHSARFLAALRADGLPMAPLRLVMNRAPAFEDLPGQAQLRRIEAELALPLAAQLPEGGEALRRASQAGQTLTATDHPFGKAVAQLGAALLAKPSARRREAQRHPA